MQNLTKTMSQPRMAVRYAGTVRLFVMVRVRYVGTVRFFCDGTGTVRWYSV